MSRKFASSVLVVLILTATGCDKKSAPESRTMMMSVSSFSASPQRYIAERDKFEIITSESDVQKSWESAVAFCSTIRCEVVSSSITARTPDSVPSGGISLRVVPEDLNKLVAHVGQLGKI